MLQLNLIDIQAQLKDYADINWNSTTQLTKYLYEDLKLPVYAYTKKGAASAGKEALSELKGEHPVIDLILQLRETEKFLNFLEQWDDACIFDYEANEWKIHCNFNLHTTVTGRTSSSEPNLQQIPRDKRVKTVFASTDPDWELVSMDYSQVELRFAGIVANIAAMKEAYNNGEDLHIRMACLITGKEPHEITKQERTQAKAANFGFIYSMSAKSFVSYAKMTYNVVISEDDAVLIRNKFFEEYSELFLYYKKVEDDLINYSEQTSIMRRPYRVNPSELLNPYTRNAILRAAINFPVQSAASDYVLCGLIEVVSRKSLKDRVKVCATVHDSIIMLIRKTDLQEFEQTVLKVKRIMEKPVLAKVLCTKTLDVPIIVDVEIGPLGLGVSLKEYMSA